MDWDKEIGFWVSGLPYIWSPSKDWEKCSRTYIIPSALEHEFKNFTNENCRSVRNYFQYVIFTELIKKGQNYRIEGVTYNDTIANFFKKEDKVKRIVVKTNKYKSLACGLEMGKYYTISDLVCMNMSSSNFSKFIGGEKCTPFGMKISENLIRVASQRIFSDPLRSLYEPVANSIDSYREMNGNADKGIGKFGMGFFSMLWWLQNERDFLEIESIYKDGDNFCVWKCRIIYNKPHYQFIVKSFSKMKKEVHTGVRILLNITDEKREKIISIINAKNNKCFKYAFYLVDDVKIIFKDTNKIANKHISDSLLENYKGDFNTKLLPYAPNTAYVNFKQQSLKNAQIVYQDYAKGMSLETLFSKLLVPSISEKGIGKFLERKLVPTNKTKVKVKKSRYNMFILAVGDMTIYTDRVFNPKRTTTYIFILSLPEKIPLPVSRDDIILDNDNHYNAVLQEILKLAYESLKLELAYGVFRDFLRKYALYANDAKIYKLLDSCDDYVSKLDDVVFVPAKHISFYNSYIRNKIKKYYFVDSENINYSKIEDLIIQNFQNLKSDRLHKNIILIPELNENITTGGLINILFLSEEYYKQNITDWEQKVLCLSKINLSLNLKDTVFDCKIIASQLIRYLHFRKTGKLVLNGVSEILEGAVLGKITKIYNKVDEIYDMLMIFVNKFKDVILSFYSDKSDINRVARWIFTHLMYAYFITDDIQFVDTVSNILYNFLISLFTREVQTSKEIDPRFRNYLYMDFKNLKDNGAIDYDRDMGKTIVWPYFFKIKTEMQKKYLIEGMLKFLSVYLDDRRGNIEISNYFNSTFLLIDNLYFRKTDFDKSRPETQLFTFLSDFLFDKNYVYSYYMKYILRIVCNYPLFVKERHVKYIFDELVIKYDIDILLKLYKYLVKYSYYVPFFSVCDNIIRSYKIFIKIEKMELYQLAQPIMPKKELTEFTAMQIINYVFENKVTPDDDISWLQKINKFSTYSQNKFQSLEIVINEGTSKFFTDSVITELVQNSLDAIRKTKAVEDRIDVFVGLMGGGYGICVKDYIGIPTNGLISILVPFLSTKSENETYSTGEMGTGFMNLYRQPYSKEVTIKTKNPNDGKIYFIHSTIIKENDRVVDILYKFYTINDAKFKGTEITVVFSDEMKEKISFLITESSIFCHKYLSYMDCQAYYNEHNISIRDGDHKHLLVETDMYKIYAIDSEKMSVMLTNGVPFGDLSTYVFSNPTLKNLDWITYFAINGLLFDLSKNLYSPVQSRKKIIFKEEFDMIDVVEHACLLSICYNIQKDKGYYYDTVMDFIPGSEYTGDCNQAKHTINDFRFSMFYARIGLYKGALSVAECIEKLVTLRFEFLLVYPEGAKIEKQMIDNELKQLNLQVNPLILEIIYLWFSNKTIPRRQKTIPAPRSFKINIEKIFPFISDIINQVWNAGSLLTKSELLKGLVFDYSPSLPPPQLKLKNIVGSALAFYKKSDHIICIDPEHLNMDRIVDGIEKLKKCSDDFAAFVLIKTNSEFGGLFNLNSNVPSLLVHEMGHAFFADEHASSGHSDINYKTRVAKNMEFFDHKHTFYNGSVNLFSFLMTDYKNPYRK